MIFGAGGAVGQTVLGAVFFALFCPGIGAAQSARDDWRELKNYIDLEASLHHSLADAPLTSEERVRIYAVIDNKVVHGSFTDAQRDQERKAVLDSRVGLITLAEDGSKQVLVRGSPPLCGYVGGNCPIWVFARQGGKLKLVLEEEGNGVFARKTSPNGFRDLVVTFHDGFAEMSFSVYLWSITNYERTDCYITKSDPNYPQKQPFIEDCPPH